MAFRGRFWHFFRPRLTQKAILAAKIFATWHLVTEYVVTVKGTYGPSMLPTIELRDDWVLISKLHRKGRGVEVGDVVSLMHPFLTGEGTIKRVLGMPGDFVMRDTPGREGEDGGSAGTDEPLIQVPKGHCWVVGDNVGSSRDSRLYGPQPLGLVKGKVLGKLHVEWGWPRQWRMELTRFENPLKPAT
ncbi:MAG: hypothetical protein M1838_003399 [Thelocarpon superellum]|nr:MAG: hypothetical protein M1838_003399 [Thelocarpon superellum]